VVLLHPWPNGVDFGLATGASLPALAGSAIRLLWAEQRLGQNPLWDHVIAKFPGLREDRGYWHQFAVFGGYGAHPGPSAVTFLQEFLQESLF
jgi:hypothetical protein